MKWWKHSLQKVGWAAATVMGMAHDIIPAHLALDDLSCPVIFLNACPIVRCSIWNSAQEWHRRPFVETGAYTSSIQSVDAFGSFRVVRCHDWVPWTDEEKAKTIQNHFHQFPAGGAGEGFSENSLPWCLLSWRTCPTHRSHRSQSSGECINLWFVDFLELMRLGFFFFYYYFSTCGTGSMQSNSW